MKRHKALLNVAFHVYMRCFEMLDAQPVLLASRIEPRHLPLGNSVDFMLGGYNVARVFLD